MWEEESTHSSYISAHDGPESARESVVDTDEEAELYSHIHHEHVTEDQFINQKNTNKSSSNGNSSGPTPSFLSLLESQKRTQETKESIQVQAKESAPTSVYGNRIYEVVRGKIKSWSKPESSILNWLGDVPERTSQKAQSARECRTAQSDSQDSSEKKALAPPGKLGAAKVNVTYPVTDSTINISPFNNGCARLESSAVNWMRDVSCNNSKPPKSPNFAKDAQVVNADKNLKVQSPRQVPFKANSVEQQISEESDKKLRSQSTSQSPRLVSVAVDASKKSPNVQAKPESNSSNNGVATSSQNKSTLQSKIAPFITSPRVMRGSATSLPVGSFSMDSQANDKLSKKKAKTQKVAFVTPLTDVGSRSAPAKGDNEPGRSRSNLSVTFSSNDESKYTYCGKRKAGQQQRFVDYLDAGDNRQGKNQHVTSDKNKGFTKKRGEKLVVDYSDSPKEVVELISEASCSVIADSEASSDLDSVHDCGLPQLELPISIAIHIGDAGRSVVLRNTSSESTVQEPKIKKRKIKNDSKSETKKPTASKSTRRSNSIVGLIKNSDVSLEEQMRKFYDSENSDCESDDVQRCVSGDWSVLDVDRHANIKATNRYFVGFDPKQKLFCGNCKQRGHVMRTCPEPRRILHCTLCGEPYHKAEFCFEMTCSRCLRRGHNTDSCQVSSKYLDPPCDLCWMPGHMEDQCPDYWRRYYLTTKVGPIVQSSTAESKAPSCYNCASKLHWGYECRKPRMCPDIYPTYPFVVSYEPPQQHRPKNHNSNRLAAGRDVAHEIHRLVAASNYVWQQESAGMRHSYKRFKSANKITVEERRQIKHEAKLKKRLENAQKSLERKARREQAGISKKNKKGSGKNFTVTTERKQNSRKIKFKQPPLNQCWQSHNAFLQETERRVNKNSLGRKRAQSAAMYSAGVRRDGEIESSGRRKKNRKNNRKKKNNRVKKKI